MFDLAEGIVSRLSYNPTLAQLHFTTKSLWPIPSHAEMHYFWCRGNAENPSGHQTPFILKVLKHTRLIYYLCWFQTSSLAHSFELHLVVQQFTALLLG